MWTDVLMLLITVMLLLGLAAAVITCLDWFHHDRENR